MPNVSIFLDQQLNKIVTKDMSFYNNGWFLTIPILLLHRFFPKMVVLKVFWDQSGKLIFGENLHIIATSSVWFETLHNFHWSSAVNHKFFLREIVYQTCPSIKVKISFNIVATNQVIKTHVWEIKIRNYTYG